MFAVSLLLLLRAVQSVAAPNQFEILEHVKLNVRAELAKSGNYTCVQTIERTYYEQKHACLADVRPAKPKEFMRDRLRLDVAVSREDEIFSWHGESRFTSSDISAVIPTGPRTSGQFVGFLRNIFLNPGVQFTFRGPSQINGKPVYTFDYLVQVLRSTYFLKGRQDSSIIPYHGDFSVDASSFELVHLHITADQIPITSGICSAETDVDYQLVNISGQQSLLPSSFVLKMDSDNDMYTVNRNEYTQCREFRGESTLHFTVVNPAEPIVTRRVVDQQLPPGLTLKASIDNSIDDKDSYMGDAVVATLADPLSVPGTKTVIPKGATLHGVISEMEQHTEGLAYWLFAVKFERLVTGEDSYVLNAWPAPALTSGFGPRFSGARTLNYEALQAARQRFWFMDGSHFKLPRHFTGYWQTLEQPKGAKSQPANSTR